MKEGGGGRLGTWDEVGGPLFKMMGLLISIKGC